MREMDEARERVPLTGTEPDTDRFQVLFAPDGSTRIVLFDDTAGTPRALATLTIGPEAADELGRVLTQRRQAHAAAQRGKRGGPRQ